MKKCIAVYLCKKVIIFKVNLKKRKKKYEFFSFSSYGIIAVEKV